MSSGHEITQLKVPLYADPRRAAELSCHFQMDDQKLHSVKWYRNMHEIFRYNPGQQVCDQLLFPDFSITRREISHVGKQIVTSTFQICIQVSMAVGSILLFG